MAGPADPGGSLSAGGSVAVQGPFGADSKLGWPHAQSRSLGAEVREPHRVSCLSPGDWRGPPGPPGGLDVTLKAFLKIGSLWLRQEG